LNRCSEDELIGEVLLPSMRQPGFHRITAAGHKDKALECGKDIWMKYTLPTMHTLYFGIQGKKDKLDATGDSKGANRKHRRNLPAGVDDARPLAAKKLARWETRCDEGQPDHVHGPRRHFEPMHRDPSALA
jgi:hypothetical protein